MQKMKINYHMHSNFSEDSSVLLMEMCEAAAKKGFDEICFTQHNEADQLVQNDLRYSMDEEKMQTYLAEIVKARKAFGSNMKIKFGVEIGYFSEYKEEIKAFVKKYPFDYVLGSVHDVKDYLITTAERPDYLSEIRTGKEQFIVDLFKDYFRLLKEMIQEDIIDCIGHLDIVRKFPPGPPLDAFRKEVMDCILAMKKHDIGFELNVKGWRYPNEECYPGIDILNLLYEAGIRKVTIGTDSHSTKNTDTNLDRGIRTLKEIGFTQVCTFDQRKPVYHEI